MDTLTTERPATERTHDWMSSSSSKGRGTGVDFFDHRAALDAMTAGFGPFKAMTMAQMEFVTFASRRAQAYLAIPQRLARCRSRQDLFEEQMRFWQTAVEQYQELTSRMMQAWTDAFGLPPMGFGPGFGQGFGQGFGMGFGAAPSQPETQSASGLIQLPVGGRKPSADQPVRGTQRRPV